jgi:hypothetical protein
LSFGRERLFALDVENVLAELFSFFAFDDARLCAGGELLRDRELVANAVAAHEPFAFGGRVWWTGPNGVPN